MSLIGRIEGRLEIRAGGDDTDAGGLVTGAGGLDTCASSSVTTAGEYGARSRRETVVSLPLRNLTWAYCGFASMSSASSTNESYFELRTCFFSNTGPGVESQDGTDSPLVERL